MHTDPLANAVAQMAQAVSDTLELKEVFALVAEAAAPVLPFDLMEVGRAETPETWTRYSVSADNWAPVSHQWTDLSPALRITPGKVMRIEDAASELTPSFSMDRELLQTGVESGLRAAIQRGDQLVGAVSFWAKRPHAFNEEHEAAIRPIRDILGLALERERLVLGLALEHERLGNLEATRRRRLDAIDSLLLTMAESLDVRGIFNRVSEVVQPVLPHDRLMLTSFSADRRVVTIDAISGEPLADLPTEWPVSECDDGPHFAREYFLIPDVEEELDEDCPAQQWCRAQGSRSVLKLSLRIDSGVGSLVFLSRKPHQYSEEDVVVARRVADHVSLALSHQRLAKEEREAAEARERAHRLQERIEELKDELEATRGYRRVIGDSKEWKDVLNQAAKVAPRETTVLLTGESGTGKEVAARFIHRASPRAEGPFVALNCAALPESLLESELFGHEKGAFTGANTARAGRIEQAAGGVLFLDEVGEMSPAVQAKLLRVLQEREFQPLGGTRPIKADVRVIAATNRDLDAALARGEFREDLYYRLRVFEIHLPPLRERRDDILALAEAFLEEHGHSVGRPAAGISREALEALLAYPWPGNVRELRNALERATILCDGGLITIEHLPIGIGRGTPARVPDLSSNVFPSAGVNLEAVERDLMVKALQEAGNNRSKAARLLGITRSQLYYRMEKHGLSAGPDGKRA